MYCCNEVTTPTTISFVPRSDTQSMHAPTTTTATIPTPSSIVGCMSFFTCLHSGFFFTVYSNKVCVTNHLLLLSLIPHVSFHPGSTYPLLPSSISVISRLVVAIYLCMYAFDACDAYHHSIFSPLSFLCH